MSAPPLPALPFGLATGATRSGAVREGCSAIATQRFWWLLTQPAVNFPSPISAEETGWLRELIENGADLQAQDAQGLTAWTLAARHNRADAVPLLLAHGNLNEAPMPDGRTPLWEAASRDNAEFVEAILPCVKNPDDGVREGKTPFMAAMSGRQARCVALLAPVASHDFPPELSGSALGLAVKQGWFDMVDILLPFTDVSKTDQAGLTPLQRAVHWDLDNLVPLLLRRFDPRAKTEKHPSAMIMALEERAERCVDFFAPWADEDYIRRAEAIFNHNDALMDTREPWDRFDAQFPELGRKRRMLEEARSLQDAVFPKPESQESLGASVGGLAGEDAQPGPSKRRL